MVTFTVEATLATIHCGECGGVYAIDETYRQKKHVEGGYWSCPYCKCGWGYSQSGSENEQLKRQKADLEAQIRAKNDAIARELSRHDQTKASLRAHKAVATKLKKKVSRVQNGVCPHCNRFFQNLHDHMNTKHSGEPEVVRP